MKFFIDITSPVKYEGTINRVSSELSEDHAARNVLAATGHWSSKRQETQAKEYIVIDYGTEVCIDYVKLAPSSSGQKTFPKKFRLEASLDGESWKVLYTETNVELDRGFCLVEVPLSIIRYIKILVLESPSFGSWYYSEIGLCECGISGIKKLQSSSVSSKEGVVENLLNEERDLSWETEIKSNSSMEYIFIDLGNVYHINTIVLGSSTRGFPEDFSVLTSIDNDLWTPLVEEREFESEPFKKYYWDVNIVVARYVRIEMKTVRYFEGSFGARLSSLHVFVAPLDIYHTHNIGELTPFASVFQAGIVKLASDGDATPGSVVQGSDRRLRDASTIFKGIVRFSDDGDDLEGTAVQASDMRLKHATELRTGLVRLAYDREVSMNAVVQSNDSRLKEATQEAFGIVKLCPPGLYSENGVVTGDDPRIQQASTTAAGICKLARNGDDTPGTVVQADDKRLREATTVYKGIVEFADDGEEKEMSAVQANDRRLKSASTRSKGIVELAEDGEESQGVVVQGSDRRLRDATITDKGIVELAEDGEDGAGVAVQGNDRRLRDATTTGKGIVELAEDGEDRPGVAVQGSDRRFKEATEQSIGIMRFAADGENSGMAAVQGNDRRLKDATTTSKGIVELAEDGEITEGVAVQGNDRRLKDATTVSKGIVELAEDGEDRSGVVVQGNDRRLRYAGIDKYGIVRLAHNNETREGLVVQAHDERLSNARAPLPHKHDYAPLDHTFNSHSGTISITASKRETIKEIAPPSDGSSVIHGKNESKEPGSVGITGIAGISTEKASSTYGVFGHSGHVGVRGQSSGGGDRKGCGVLGLSRFGAGGCFASEHSFSLVADGFGKIEGFDNTVNLIGNGDALLVKGRSDFDGPIYINHSYNEGAQPFPVNIVELFEVDDEEFISPGDLLVIRDTGKSILSRSRTAYNRSVTGVVSGNPSVIINNSGVEKKVYPVVLAGKAICKVDARTKPVNPGDLIVTSDTPGCGMSGSIDSFERIGTVIGKALDALEDGIDLIPVFIAHH